MTSIDLPEVQQIEGEENWMTPIMAHLMDGRLLEERDEARKLRVRSAKYVLIDEVLYKRGFSQPHLRSMCNHSRARTLVHKVIHVGYYWPTIQEDLKAYVKVCDQCQHFSNIHRSTSP